MKKIFEIEWDEKQVRFDDSANGIWELLVHKWGILVNSFKVTELPQPTEYCECEKPGLNFSQDMCQVCNKPIKPKPKIEKLNLGDINKRYVSVHLANIEVKLNEIIEWINKESK